MKPKRALREQWLSADEETRRRRIVSIASEGVRRLAELAGTELRSR